MQRLVQCIANFSEGRRQETVDEIVAAVRSVPGLMVLEVEPDADHNRTVIGFVGEPDATLEGAFRAVSRAAELIDMDRHQGAHPRIGAADVVPFVPLAGVTLAECAGLARRLGARVGAELAIPVYLYGEAATRAERRSLPTVRKGEYEGLKAAIASDPARAPDFGPARLGPAGATAVGAREPLIAFNVNLRSNSVELAKGIARHVRESSGGLPGIRAIGLAVSEVDMVQVSMNLTDYRQTGIMAAFAAVRDEAARHGVEVKGSQIVGLIPADALAEVVAHALRSPAFSASQVVERAILGGEEGRE